MCPGDDLRKAWDLIVFDLDGTLVDSREDIVLAMNRGLAAVGGPSRSAEDIVPLIGQPLEVMFTALLPDGLGHRANEAAEVYRRTYPDHCIENSRPFPGVVECLEALTTVPKAVATTKRTGMAVQVVDGLGLTRHFVLVQGSDGLPCKPDPAILLHVLGRTGARADRSWMVGDTAQDVQAGKGAGMRTCGVTCGFGDRADLIGQRPDLVLEDLAILPYLLRESG